MTDSSIDDNTIKKELTQLSRKFVFEVKGADVDSTDTLTLWKRMFGAASPAAVYGALSKNMDPLTVFSKVSDNSEHNTIDLQYGKSSAISSHLEFSFMPKDDEVNMINAEVTTKRHGTSQQVMANFYDFLSLLPSRTKLTGTAAMEGSYVWPKFGFVPTQEAWRDVSKGSKDKPDDKYPFNIRARKKFIKDQLTRAESRALDILINSDDPKAIWAIADWPVEKMVTIPPNIAQGRDDILEDMLPVGKSIPLREYLLIDAGWDCVLDFKEDKEAKEKFLGYLSKLSISPALAGKAGNLTQTR